MSKDVLQKRLKSGKVLDYRCIYEVLILTAQACFKTHFLYELWASGYEGSNQYLTNCIYGYNIRCTRKGHKKEFLYNYSTLRHAIERFNELTGGNHEHGKLQMVESKVS